MSAPDSNGPTLPGEGTVPRGLRHALAGVAIGLGAPLGWLAIRVAGGVDLTGEVSANLGLYAYMTLGTCTAFGVFGAMLGARTTQIAALAQRFHADSVTDALTSLRNQRYFWVRLDEAWGSATRTGVPLSLIIFDIDHFKRVNDVHGHPVGDLALVEAARAIESVMRSGETIARVGGEEFAMILPRADAAVALAAAERARAAVAKIAVPVEGGVVTFTISAGVACTQDLIAGDPRGLYNAADQALYAAKAGGRNRTSVAGPPDDADSTASAPAPAAETEEGRLFQSRRAATMKMRRPGHRPSDIPVDPAPSDPPKAQDLP